jgi:hypothetical protein
MGWGEKKRRLLSPFFIFTTKKYMKKFIRSKFEPISKLMWYDWNKIMLEDKYQVPENILRECVGVIGFWLIYKTQNISNDFYREYQEHFDSLKERLK